MYILENFACYLFASYLVQPWHGARAEFGLYSAEPMLESSRFLEEGSSKSRNYVNAHGALSVKRKSEQEGDICENTGECEQDFRRFVVIERITERSLNPVKIFCLLVALFRVLNFRNLIFESMRINIFQRSMWSLYMWNTESQIWNGPATKKNPMISHYWSAVNSVRPERQENELNVLWTVSFNSFASA